MELASKEERVIMEEKERRQRDFFAQMESNILKSMSQGVLPGGASPSQKAKALSSSTNNIPTPASNPRSPKTNLRTALKQITRPSMVRTISSMDEDVLKDLVKRVPSTRDLMGKKSRNKAGANKRENNTPLDALDEAKSRDFELGVDDLLSSLPSDGLSTVVEDDLHSSSMFQESSSSFTSGGFLSWEETRALQKLAQVTHEMALMPDESSPMRDVTEATYEEDDFEFEDDNDDKEAPLEIQWNGGPHDFTEMENSPSPHEVSPPTVLQPPKPEAKESPTGKPELKRRNTCGTLYVGTTMSAPDKDATIRVSLSEAKPVKLIVPTKVTYTIHSVLNIDRLFVAFSVRILCSPRRTRLGLLWVQRWNLIAFLMILSHNKRPVELVLVSNVVERWSTKAPSARGPSHRRWRKFPFFTVTSFDVRKWSRTV
jgi:hypothetical protein